jgi:hypothetical protein
MLAEEQRCISPSLLHPASPCNSDCQVTDDKRRGTRDNRKRQAGKIMMMKEPEKEEEGHTFFPIL